MTLQIEKDELGELFSRLENGYGFGPGDLPANLDYLALFLKEHYEQHRILVRHFGSSFRLGIVMRKDTSEPKALIFSDGTALVADVAGLWRVCSADARFRARIGASSVHFLNENLQVVFSSNGSVEVTDLRKGVENRFNLEQQVITIRDLNSDVRLDVDVLVGRAVARVQEGSLTKEQSGSLKNYPDDLQRLHHLFAHPSRVLIAGAFWRF